jgi:hypothetical protein
MHYLSDDHLKNSHPNKEQLENRHGGLQFISPYLSKAPLQASITKKAWFLAPLLPQR